MATVLIVDDDPKLLTMLRRTLAYEGFRVLSATNGTEALGEVQAHRPDVVVLDWLMPGLDGIGVLEHLRAAGDKTLVLMLTAATRSKTVSRGWKPAQTIIWSSRLRRPSCWRASTRCSAAPPSSPEMNR